MRVDLPDQCGHFICRRGLTRSKTHFGLQHLRVRLGTREVYHLRLRPLSTSTSSYTIHAFVDVGQ